MHQAIAGGPLTDSAQTPADVFQGGGPAHPLEPAAAPAAQWVQHPVGVILHLGHCNFLGAGVAARNRMLRIRVQGHQAPVLDGGREAAERLADPAEGHALLGWHWPSSSVDAARHRDCNCARSFSKLHSVRVAKLMALTAAVFACNTPANAPAASPVLSASASGLVLAAGTFRLPAASAFGEPGFHEPVTIRANVPVAPAPAAGRTFVVALRESSRPGQSCREDHPLSGCATVDWSDSPGRPKVPAGGVFDNSLTLPLAGGPGTLFLRADGTLNTRPEAFDPG